MKKLLVLTNGAGEDAIAMRILAELPLDIADDIVCCPLVGAGHALSASFELVGPRVLPPSEGLFRESLYLAFKDLVSGVIRGHLKQLTFLRQIRSDVGLTVAVGDLFPVLWASLAGFAPLVFIGTAKSVYHHPYSWIERWILSRFVAQSVVRDEATADHLTALGLKAMWLGNAMMDEARPTGRPLPFARTGPLVLLLPGSRSQAAEVLPYQLEAVSLVRQNFPELQAAVAAAPGVQVEAMIAPSLETGWQCYQGQGEGLVGILERGGWEIPVLEGRLGDLLARASVALGQAGTANEQAAGMGIPVIAFEVCSRKPSPWYRARQKGLLGEAVSVVEAKPEALARELSYLLAHPDERLRRASIGQERMGPAGGSARMAEMIGGFWKA